VRNREPRKTYFSARNKTRSAIIYYNRQFLVVLRRPTPMYAYMNTVGVDNAASCRGGRFVVVRRQGWRQASSR